MPESIVQWFMSPVPSALVLATGTVLCLVAAAAWLSARRQSRLQRAQMEHLRADFRALVSAAKGVGQRVLEVERRQRHLAQRQEQLDLYESANQPYEQAIRLARRGMPAHELMDVCGISQGEAELINLLHRLDEVG